MANFKYLKNKMFATFKLISEITISSIILINCYSSLINNTIKKNEKKLKTDMIEPTVKIATISKKENTVTPNLNISYIPDDVIKNVIEDFGQYFINNPEIKLNINMAVYQKMVDLGVIIPQASIQEKVDWILKNYNLTMSQFKVIIGVVLAEAGPNNYEECYAVINTIFNRSICSRWVNSANQYLGEGKGTNLYSQVINKNQFSVYFAGNKPYRFYTEETPETMPGVMAIIDFLYGTFSRNPETFEIVWNGPAVLHDTVSFVGNSTTPGYDYYMYSSIGNKHGVHMKEEEYLTHHFTKKLY